MVVFYIKALDNYNVSVKDLIDDTEPETKEVPASENDDPCTRPSSKCVAFRVLPQGVRGFGSVLIKYWPKEEAKDPKTPKDEDKDTNERKDEPKVDEREIRKPRVENNETVVLPAYKKTEPLPGK
jgi:hypothetical protein